MQTRKEDRAEVVVLCKVLDSHKKCKDSVKQLLKVILMYACFYMLKVELNNKLCHLKAFKAN